MEHVRWTVEEAVARVSLDRPEVRNAISGAMADELTRTFDRIPETGARCVLLEGAGDAFCAGGDVGAMVEARDDDLTHRERITLIEQSVSRAVKAVYACDLPVVAMVDGAAYGAGAGLLLACDLQLGSPDAKVGFGFRRLGLAVDTGVSYLLPRYVGPNTAKELVFTGELVDADRARSLGLLTRLFERDSFEEGVDSIVETVASGPTAALSTSKELLNESRSSLAAATDDEERAQARLLQSADHEEGASAFLQEREPEFVGR